MTLRLLNPLVTVCLLGIHLILVELDYPKEAGDRSVGLKATRDELWDVRVENHIVRNPHKWT